MSVRIRHFDSREAGHIRHHPVPLTTATSQTSRPFHVFTPGCPFTLTGLAGFCRTEAGAVTATAQLAGDNAVLVAGTLAIDAVPEDFKITNLSRYMVGGAAIEKAAATGISFSAAYTINTGTATGQFWGAFLVQITAAGVVSTKAVAADQVYASEALAIAALPAADASNLAIGYITVQSKTDIAWTANTDDLTAASDCAAANFYDIAAVPAAVASAVAFVSGKSVTVDPSATLTAKRDVTGDKHVVLSYTSDGSGALTDGAVTVRWRPIPMYRDPSLGLG